MWLALLAAPASALLAGSSWRLGLNIGREPGTAMPAAWGASGARLALPLDIDLLDEACDASIRPVEERLLGYPVTALRPASPTSFVGASGEEQVVVGPGAWAATALPADERYGRPAEGRYALRFFVDVPAGAARNDVDCPAGRVFFTTEFWTAEALAGCEAAAAEAQHELDEQQAQLDEMTRAQGEGNPIARALAVRRSVLLLESRQTLKARLSEAQKALPDAGTVEGPGGLRVNRRGRLSVKRPGRFGVGDFYFILGTFSMKPREAKSR